MRNIAKLFVVVAALVLGLVAAQQSVTVAAEKKEKEEVKIKLTDCPQAVQDAFAKESKGAKKPIESVDKETAKDGTVTYEADVVLEDGKNYEILIAADGKLIHKKLDEEEEKKDDQK